jgi:hypothetical protein
MRTMLDGTSIVGNPQTLFTPCESVGRTSPEATEWHYDVSANGTRFLFVCNSPESGPLAINVIVNWQSKLR